MDVDPQDTTVKAASSWPKMVYYFTCNAVSPPVTLYMGKDKFENEDLIKHGLPHDVWFHVDNLSSAHVYLRLPEGMTWDSIPPEILTDCAQLTKANSIDGNKKDNITVIYTPWRNLHKQASMATGQIGFHRQKQVKKVLIEKRVNEIINRLNKTKVEKFPDLAAEKAEFEKEERRKEKAALQEKRKEEERLAKEKKLKFEDQQKTYNDLYGREAMERAAESKAEDYDPEEDFW